MRRLPWRRRGTEPSREAEPPGVLRRFREEMDRLFDAFIVDPWDYVRGAAGRWTPDVDVLEGDREITVRAEVPGLDPEDVEVTVTGDSLTLSGEKREEEERTGRTSCRSERRYGAFRREIPLPPGSDPSDVKAEYDRGVLQVRIGKREGAARRRIPVTRKEETRP